MATKKPSSSRPSVLLFADTDHSADALYFGNVSIPDPFIAFSKGNRRYAILGRLEFNRVRTNSSFNEVLPYEDWAERARTQLKTEGVTRPTAPELTAAMIESVAKAFDITAFRLPFNFPAGLAHAMTQRKITFEVVDGLLFPKREIKTEEEAAAVREGNAAAEAGFKVVAHTLRKAEIRRGKLYFENRILTAERLRERIAIACLSQRADAGQVIVAGGDQACDPHHRGSGPLRPHELIIVDIFPRVQRTGYHGDMTRTFLKGRASDAQHALVQTVLDAHQQVLPKHRAGASAKSLYMEVRKHFQESGYPTETKDGVSVGFFHGLGHGLGLEVHEPPRVSPAGGRLRAGQVVTVEPGLYYPGLGGCRIEDVIHVTKGEPTMLSSFPYRWEIR